MAVITPFGLFQFLRMAFVLRNGGSSFQRMMDRVISGLAFDFCYLDDIHVASRSPEEHMTHLRILFQQVQHFGLVINLEKCTFHVKEIEFLGHSVSARGALPLSSNVEAVQHFPEPATVKDMHGLGQLLPLFHSKCRQHAASPHRLPTWGTAIQLSFVLDTYDDTCLPAGKSGPLQC